MRIILFVLSLSLIPINSFAAVTFVEADSEDCDASANSCTETAHAAGGSGTITIVAQHSEDSTATDRDTAGCTMNGDAMTRVSDNEIIVGNLEMDVYYKVAGTAGNIVCTWAGSPTGAGMQTLTYSGTSATGQPDAVAEDSDAANTVIQQNIVTVTANDMIIDFLGSTNGATSCTPDGSQVERAQTTTGQLTMCASELLVTTATTYTQGQTVVDSSGLTYKIFAIKTSAFNKYAFFEILP